MGREDSGRTRQTKQSEFTTMTHAEEILKHRLAQAIQNWINEECEEPEWGKTEILFPDESVQRMTEAAFAVFATIYEAQRFAIREGYVKPIKP